ncbi:MAG: protease modulator HflC [Desulfomicrobiaceae bacterium]|nr:protease modulator HflC [Desulfomicrobiaceae bacterium]
MRIQIAVVAAIMLVVAAWECVYVVDETQRAIVLELGRPVGEASQGPGLHFKLPFIQKVEYFDARVLEYDAPPAEVLTRDKKNLVVDNYSRWRIADPLLFYRSVRSIPGALARIDDVVYSQVREVLGRYLLTEVVAEERATIMEEVRQAADTRLHELGIAVVDVRIKRTDLPPENQKAIYGRMRAERERQAKQYRSEGREEAAKITSGADRKRAVLLAEANRRAAQLRGEGEAQATAIYAESFGQDPKFYGFWRSLEAYRNSLTNGTDVVLTPQSEFLQYLR